MNTRNQTNLPRQIARPDSDTATTYRKQALSGAGFLPATEPAFQSSIRPHRAKGDDEQFVVFSW